MFLPRRAHAIAPFLRSSRLHRHAVARTFILLKKFSSDCVGNASSPAKTVSLARISASDSHPESVVAAVRRCAGSASTPSATVLIHLSSRSNPELRLQELVHRLRV